MFEQNRKFVIKGSKKTFKVSQPSSDSGSKFTVKQTPNFESEKTFHVQETSETEPKIENIIRQLDDPSNLPHIDSSIEAIVCIDAKTGDERPIGRLGRLKNFGRELRYYWVSNQNTIESAFVCTVKDIPSNRAIDIHVAYEARCEQGNEYKVVRALYKSDHLSKTFDKLIDKWIKKYAQNKTRVGIHFLTHYFQLREELQEQISQHAQQEVGLILKTHIALVLEKEGPLIPFEISSDYFPVRVKDCDDELELKLNTVLQINEEHKINSVLAYERRPQLERLVQEQIQSFFWENATLPEFIHQLNGSIRERLIVFLNNVLIQEGRKISVLSLESRLSLPEDFLSFKISVEDCTVQKSSTPIRVKHELQMKLDDIRKYKAAKIENLEDWINQKLAQITKTVLFEKTYAELIKSFDENETNKEIPNEIKAEIETETQKIGYTVQHHLVKPQDVEILVLQRDGLSFEKNGNFTTYNTDTEVKLTFVMEGKIRNLEKITPYINPNTSIIEEIGKTALEEARQLIHTINAERFYMRFAYTDIEGEIPVEQELKSRIVAKLEGQFGLEEVSVTPKLLETDIAKRFKALLEGYESFEFETFPLGDRGRGEKMKFSLAFKVRSVGQGGWNTFQSNNFKSRADELGKVKKILEDDLKTKLETIPSNVLQYGDIKDYPEIRRIVDISIEKIVEVFGLEIEIIVFRRLATETEKQIQEKYNTDLKIAIGQDKTRKSMAQLNDNAKLAELETLFKKRLALIAGEAEDDDEDLVLVNERINAILKENPSYAIETDVQKKLLEQPTEQSSELRLADFQIDRKALPSSQQEGETRNEQM
ncbi:MAG: hypothetical protein KAI83_20030 [Thiomargarita sp.]|nr:hypothetical protein [Thiomargarita sp.]